MFSVRRYMNILINIWAETAVTDRINVTSITNINFRMNNTL